MDFNLDESWLAGDIHGFCTASALELDPKVNQSDIWDRLLLGQHSGDSEHLAVHLGLDDGGFGDVLLHIGPEAKAQGIWGQRLSPRKAVSWVQSATPAN
jgi:hypothetical protein